MERRMDYVKAFPEGYKAMLALETAVRRSGLDRKMLELVKIRSSQINGCAFCLDMHTKDARAIGETEQRIYTLNAWREAPFYSERERAALELTEAITLVSTSHVDDAIYASARKVFSEEEIARLVFAIVTINSWNRLAITFRPAVGEYQPRHEQSAAD